MLAADRVEVVALDLLTNRAREGRKAMLVRARQAQRRTLRRYIRVVVDA